MKTIRRIWWLVMLGLLIAMVVGINIHVDQVAGPAFVGMIFWYFFGTFTSRIIGAMTVSSFRCKGCGLEVPAVDKWTIGSFTDHRPRHVLLAKNPIDGARVGHINCPQCSTTIFV